MGGDPLDKNKGVPPNKPRPGWGNAGYHCTALGSFLRIDAGGGHVARGLGGWKLMNSGATQPHDKVGPGSRYK